MLVYDLGDCIWWWFAEALYEKKQRSVAYDVEVAKLQAQAEQLESAAKGSQGKVIHSKEWNLTSTRSMWYAHSVAYAWGKVEEFSAKDYAVIIG